MSGLRKFIGSREGGSDVSRPTSQGISHVEGEKERLHAKAQELGYTDLKRSDLLSNSAFEPANASNPRRKINADQHRVKVPGNLLSRNSTGSKSLKSIGHGYDSSSGTPRAVQGLSGKNQETSYDLFDTDAESLEATATFSDFTDPRDAMNHFQGFALSGSSLNKAHGDKNGNSHVSLPIMEERQRAQSHIFDQDGPDNLTEDEEESENEGSREDDSAEDRPEHDGDDNDRMVEEFIVRETTQQPEYTIGFHPRPTEFLSSAKKNMESALALPPLFPENGQDSARKHSNEPLRTIVVPLASRNLGRSASDEKHDQSGQNGQRRLQEANLKQDQVRPNETTHNDAARNILVPKTGTPENMPANNQQVFRENTHKQHGLTNSELPHATISTILRRPHEPGKLPLIDDSGYSPTRDDPNLTTVNARKRATDLDYTPAQLTSMTYEQLSNESFDDDPHPPKKHNPEDHTYTALAEKLQYIYNLKNGDKQHLQQREVFSSMTIAQHEECGDLLIEKFSAIIRMYKEARQQKRKLAIEFEDEVARREEHVRGKKEAVERDLRRLRRAGEDVVKGRDN